MGRLTSIERKLAWLDDFEVFIFQMLIVLSGFLLSVPGDYWPSYTVKAAFALVPLAVGYGRYRLNGAVALVLSISLIVSDIVAGKHFRTRQPEIRR